MLVGRCLGFGLGTGVGELENPERFELCADSTSKSTTLRFREREPLDLRDERVDIRSNERQTVKVPLAAQYSNRGRE